MSLNLIAAIGNQGQLGLNGKLPWHDPDDLRWFKELTTGGLVLVGYNTAIGLPPLPGRKVVVDTADLTVEHLESLAQGGQVWVAGGARTYKRWLPHVNRMYISRINYSGEADTYMPHFW